MERMKKISMMTAVFTQILGIIFLFVQVKIALCLFLLYGISLLVLFLVLIKQRLDEKREDEQNDYRNY
ncbi:hypothetical protein [Metabacillus niabensis]|uniref:Heme A synthase n=1 Tax=Metabacillus niabensis TaxID=324854 RepID=A0ABT9YX52_9BACI|nr:hypothetical protein [Metabacillus niabensis]MDQ0224299.1 heme A synthase [Metabacillus niabensis]